MALLAVTAGATALAQEPEVRLHAAGSLRFAMAELAKSYRAAGGGEIATTFGASGLLRERIEKGEAAEVFASADVANAQRLADAHRSTPPVVFARNQLCVLVAPGVVATEDTLLERMLDPAVRIGTSTPGADPSGDYAWQLFENADRLRPGAYDILDRKALKLTGGPDSPPPPSDGSIYTMLIAARKADLFLTYCTNAMVAAREVPGARMLMVPASLAVGASYALVVLNDARPAARNFALFVLSVPGQALLAHWGFVPVASP